MKIGLNLKPGQSGTKKLLAQYGERLVCVRYRYDESRKKRYKTAEIIIEEADWQPKPKPFKNEEMVGIPVTWQETDLRNKLKQAGGKWNQAKKVWEIRYDRAIKLGLKSRITRSKSI